MLKNIHSIFQNHLIFEDRDERSIPPPDVWNLVWVYLFSRRQNNTLLTVWLALLLHLEIMENETITKAAELLQQACTMLLLIEENLPQTKFRSNSPATNSGTQGTTTTAVPELRETLERAKSMMASSSNAGLYRRLKKNERLRAAAGKSSSSSSKKVRNSQCEIYRKSRLNLHYFEHSRLKVTRKKKIP